MEHWTAGHGTAFVLGLLLVYMVWMPRRFFIETKTAVLGYFVLTVGTMTILLLLASMASSGLGIPGAFAALLGGIAGLQMVAITDFSVVQRQKTKKSPEAEEAIEEEEE